MKNNEENIRIDISGGHSNERELLTDAIAATLTERGFNNVRTQNAEGFPDNVFLDHKANTIFAAVMVMRPDLMNRQIDVIPKSEYADVARPGKVYCAVSHGHNAIADRNGNATVKQTLAKAKELDLPATEIAVRGTSIEDVVQSVRTALILSPDSYVTASLTSQSHDRNPENMRYYAPDRDVQEKEGSPFRSAPWRLQAPLPANNMENLRHVIAEDMVKSPGFQQLVADIAHDMYVDSVRAIDAEEIGRRSAEEFRKTLDERYPPQPPLDPETRQKLEDTVKDLKELAEGRGFRVQSHTGTAADDDNDPMDDIPAGAVVDDRRVYVPPKDDKDLTPSEQILKRAGELFEADTGLDVNTFKPKKTSRVKVQSDK